MQPASDQRVQRDLGNGLVLRRARQEDAESLIDFNHGIHDDGNWTRNLVEGQHPTTSITDFTVVEDKGSGKIVSSMVMIPQRWSYGGVEFDLARPDLVGTDPAYRNRGLVRAQFDVIHHWSARRSHMMQAIVGRPWFYRQFGYAMAVPYGGGWEAAVADIPPLKDGEIEPVRLRPAEEEDIPFCRGLYDQVRSRKLLSCVRNEQLFRYEMFQRGSASDRTQYRVIEDLAGQRLGFLIHGSTTTGPIPPVFICELIPGASWLQVAPSILRYLARLGEQYVQSHPEAGARPMVIDLVDGMDGLFAAMPDLLKRPYRPLAWYLRIPDMVAWIRTISPVLDQRLAASVCAGHTGQTRISFYRGGLVLHWERGRLIDVVPLIGDRGDAYFPVENFIQLVFGSHPLAELLDFCNPEVSASRETEVLLAVLFPKQSSRILSVY